MERRQKGWSPHPAFGLVVLLVLVGATLGACRRPAPKPPPTTDAAAAREAEIQRLEQEKRVLELEAETARLRLENERLRQPDTAANETITAAPPSAEHAPAPGASAAPSASQPAATAVTAPSSAHVSPAPPPATTVAPSQGSPGKLDRRLAARLIQQAQRLPFALTERLSVGKPWHITHLVPHYTTDKWTRLINAGFVTASKQPATWDTQSDTPSLRFTSKTEAFVVAREPARKWDGKVIEGLEVAHVKAAVEDLGEVTGITQTVPTEALVEFTTITSTTEIGEILWQNPTGERHHGAILRLYDDGWRVAAVDLEAPRSGESATR